MPTIDELVKNGVNTYSYYQPEAKPPEDGNFVRGLKRSMYQIPETLGGTAALVGDMTGVDGLRDYGMDIYEKNHAKGETLTRPSDSLTSVLQGEDGANVGDFLTGSAGYVAGQAATALATGGVGGFIGKQLAARGIKSLVAGSVENAAAKLAAEKALSTGTKLGAGTALFGSNLSQEAGSIYPEALEQAKKDGRELDAGDKARIVGSALAAAGVETAMDARMFHRITGGGRKEGESLARAALREVPGGMAKEAATEGIQTGMERYGAGQNLTNAEAIRDYVDSMGVGAVGGGLGGAAGVVRAQKVEETGPLTRAANTSIEQKALQLEHNPDPLISFPDGSVGTKSYFEAALSTLTPDEQLAERRRVMGRDPETGKRIKPEEPPEPTAADSQAASAANIKAWSDQHDPVTLDYAQNLLSAPGAKGLDFMIAPHSSGKGYTVVPSKWLTLHDQTQAMALQKGDEGRLPAPDREAPGGRMIVDSEGGAAKETYGDQTRAAAGRAKMEAAAARREELGTPVPYGKKAVPRETNSAITEEKPVITETDAQKVVKEVAQPETPAGVPDTILNPNGQPFVSEFSAKRRLKADNLSDTHEVVKVDDGFVVQRRAPTTDIDQAAHAASTSPENDLQEPTQAQKEAGNYKKGHVNLHGLDISIENPVGSVRSGVDRNGKPWSNTMQHHYGYIRGTVGADKDHIDTFIGKRHGSQKVFVVDQVHPETGKFDEHKVILGVNSLREAKAVYAANYAKGWTGGKNVSETSLEGFKTWLKDGDTKKPFDKNFVHPSNNIGQASALDKKKPSTAAQRARDKLKASDPFRAFLAEHGVHPDDRADSGIESKANTMTPGYGPIFKKSASRLDILATKAMDAGFLTQSDIDSDTDNGGTRKLADMIRRAINEREIIQHASEEPSSGKQSVDDQLMQDAHAAGIETEGKTADQVYDELMGLHADAVESITEEMTDDEINKLFAEAGQSDRDDQENSRIHESERAQGSDAAPEGKVFELASETADEVRAKVAKEEKRQADEAAATKAADDKAKADAEVDGFVMTGSNRAADANPNQGDIFSKPEKSTITPDVKSEKQEASAPAAKIDDFGEKIHGARKDIWTGFKDRMNEELPSDFKDVTLSKHFPEPDYEAMIGEGADIRTLAAIKGMRDEIPAKPKLKYKLTTWGNQVKTLRDFSAKLLNGEISIDRLFQELRAAGPLMKKFSDRIKMYADLGYPAFKQAHDFSITSGFYTLFNGKEYSPGITKFEVNEKHRTLGYFDSYDDALAALRKKLDVTPDGSGKQVKLDLYRVSSSGDIVIGKKVSSGKYIDLKGGFKTPSEARKYAAEHEAELLQELARKKEVNPERRSVNDPRVGKDRRFGEDVPPEKFAATFGFRGVQFGNYVEQARRAKDLNNTYDALLDLADIIGVPERALSLNGELGIAFGARGRGGVSPAAAHYEQENIVINLTKGNGAGSLAHEWFHALDNYFSRMRGDEIGFVTNNPRVKMKAGANRTVVADDSVRPEVLAAFKGVIDAIKASGLPARSGQRDSTRSKDYWSQTIEMAARSFESYIIDKAAARGESNDYLANILGEDAHNVLKEMTNGSDDFAYPTKAEKPAINAAFDKLFQTIEARPGENGNVMLANINKHDNPIFYSALARAVPQLAKIAGKDGMVNPDQALAWLAARQKEGRFKAEELEWSGLKDWLGAADGKVAVSDIDAFLRANGVQVHEVMKKEESLHDLSDAALSRRYAQEYGEGEDTISRAEMIDALTPDIHAEGYSPTGTGTKYGGKYVLPGGENYRELLLTLPDADGDRFKVLDKKYSDGTLTPDENDEYSKLERTDNSYKSSHWDEPNIIAHVRFNDRTDADGKKVLFIEELQSDWGQEGKKKGFKFAANDAELKAAKSEMMELNHRDSFGPRLTQAERARLDALIVQTREGTLGAVPNAPFVNDTKAWLSLGIKRMIRYAAENGYDKIAFVNGEQSAARYDLSKQISRVQWITRPVSAKGTNSTNPTDGTIRAWDTRGKSVIDQNVDAADLPDIVGKDVAEKLINSDVNSQTGSGKDVRQMEGMDLKVGGEGMKTFYDKIVPQVANDVLKKIGGGKVGMVDINTGHANAEEGGYRVSVDGEFQDAATMAEAKDIADRTGGTIEKLGTSAQQSGFDITPELRSSAMVGLPLFNRNGEQAKPDAKQFDKSLYADVQAGKSTTDILKNIAAASQVPQYRQLAQALIDAGIKSKIEIGEAQKQDFVVKSLPAGMTYAAGYAPKADAVMLFQAGDAERNIIHELVHGATYHAVRKGGINAAAMKALYHHVNRSGVMDGQYGMENHDEFVAEAMSNPEFQDKLRAIKAMPTGSRFKNAWDWFVDLVRRIVGLPAKSATALDQALQFGRGMMQENTNGNADIDGGLIAGINTNTAAFKTWFGDSKVVDSSGKPMAVYHASDADFDTFKPNSYGTSGDHAYYYFAKSKAYARNFYKDERFTEPPFTHRVYLSLQNPLDLTDKVLTGAQWLNFFDGLGVTPADNLREKWEGAKRMPMPAWKALRFDTPILGNIREQLIAKGYDGLIMSDATRGKADNQVFVAFKPEQIKSATANNGNFDPSNPSMLAAAGTLRDAMRFRDQWETDDGQPIYYGHGWVLQPEKTLDTSADMVPNGLPMGQVAFVDAGNKVHAYTIRDKNEQVIGTAALQVDPRGEVVAIHDIDVKIKKQGLGTKIVGAIMASSKNPVRIIQMIPSAQSFWEQAGVYGQDTYDNGTIDWQSFAQSDRGRAAGVAQGNVQGRSARTAAGSESKSAQELSEPLLPNIGKESTVAGAFDMLRSAGALGATTNALKSLAESSRKFNLWDRTVGTQFNKATKDSDFKRVFDAFNQQTNDIAHYAIEAERQAPTVLQRLESVKDIGRALLNSGARYKADLEAVSKALFANIEGKSGVQQEIFTDQQLHDDFGLNDAQIMMYKEARNAVDTSIDRLAQTTIASMGEAAGIDIASLRNMDPATTAKLVKQVSGKDSDVADRVDDILKHAADLKRAGYMPAMRFGQYGVSVFDPNTKGDPLYFEMFESQLAANVAANKLAKEYPGMRIDKSVLNKELFTMFKGVSPETVELFAKFSGMDENEAYQDYIALAKSSRSSMQRMINRKGIAGFSEDVPRVLASFITSNARQASLNMNSGEVNEAMASPTLAKKGDVQQEAQKLHQYMANPLEEAQRLRGFLFMHFLGGSVASAAVNLTQPVLQTAPYLSQFAGAKTVGIMASSAKMAATGKIGNAELKDAADRAAEEGLTEPQEIHQLMADASGSTLGSSLRARALTKAWGGFFSISESFNRRLTFLAAYQTAQQMSKAELKQAGFDDAYSFAARAIIETQGLYSKTNRPNWARGAVGATLFTFKQFSISYIEFLNRLPPQQKMIALGVLVLAAGLQGLPFADDLEDIIDTIGQSLGYNTNSKKALRDKIHEVLGDDLGKVLTYGLSSQTAIDLHGRLGMSNLIPGTALFKMSEKDKGRDVAEFAGALGGVLTSFQNAAAKAQAGDLLGKSGALATLTPVALKNALQGAEMAQTGEYKDARGRKVQEVDAIDAVVKALGFQPEQIAAESRRIQAIQQDKGMTDAVKTAISERWAASIAEGDQDGIQAARDALKTWNEKNPDTTIRIQPRSVLNKAKEMRLSKEERFVKSMPKAQRDRVRAALDD